MSPKEAQELIRKAYLAGYLGLDNGLDLIALVHVAFDLLETEFRNDPGKIKTEYGLRITRMLES